MAIDWNSWIGKKIDNGFGELEILEVFEKIQFNGNKKKYFKLKCFCDNFFTAQCVDTVDATMTRVFKAIKRYSW